MKDDRISRFFAPRKEIDDKSMLDNKDGASVNIEEKKDAIEVCEELLKSEVDVTLSSRRENGGENNNIDVIDLCESDNDENIEENQIENEEKIDNKENINTATEEEEKEATEENGHVAVEEEKELIVESNPFAKFAFGTNSDTNFPAVKDEDKKSHLKVQEEKNKPERTRKWISSSEKKCSSKKKGKKNECGWIPFLQLSSTEQDSIKRKWQGLVVTTTSESNNDRSTSQAPLTLEERRFQVFVSSRLHARCQEVVVRKCMQTLYDHGFLTCVNMAQADASTVAALITSLQYYNAKSKHLIKASNELLERFDGEVPENKEDLLQLTGIGPVMADLLSNVNTRAAYDESK